MKSATPFRGKPQSLLIFLVTFLTASHAQHEIIVGTLADTFHQIETAVVVQLLRDLGHSVSTVGFPNDEGGTMPHDEIFALFFDGSIDLLPSVWLPDGHDFYVSDKQLGVDYDILGTTSEEGSFYWAVSPAAAAAGVTSMNDLVNPPADFDRVIRVPDSTTGLAMASVQIAGEINDSPGSTANLEISAGFDDEMAFLESHMSDAGNTSMFAVGYWNPWWGNAVYEDLVRLDYGSFGDPFGRVNRGVTLVRPAALSRLPSSTQAAISRLFVGNAAIVAGDLAVGYVKNETAFEAAAAWMASTESGGGAYWVGILESDNVGASSGNKDDGDDADEALIVRGTVFGVLVFFLLVGLFACIYRYRDSRRNFAAKTENPVISDEARFTGFSTGFSEVGVAVRNPVGKGQAFRGEGV